MLASFSDLVWSLPSCQEIIGCENNSNPGVLMESNILNTLNVILNLTITVTLNVTTLNLKH